jgi:DNA modification methylase
MLIDGHARREVVGDGVIPVLVLDVTEEEADKLLATLDPIAAMAERDSVKLQALLAEISVEDAGLQALIDDMLAVCNEALAELETGGGDEPLAMVEDDCPPVKQGEPITKFGDLYRLGEHYLMCGDSRRADMVSKLFGGVKPFLMVTDPPYGVNYDPRWRLEAGVNKAHQTRAEGKVTNDDNASWKATWDLFPGMVAYVWHGALHADVVAGDLKASGFTIRSQIIWAKPSLVIGRGAYHWRHEPCWYASRGTAKWNGGRKQNTVWEIANMHRTQGKVDDGKTFHGTQKPVECMGRPITNHGTAEDAIYDPFGGSGTTMIAAEQLGRVCYMMEIDPTYCDLIVERWEKLTTKKAVLISQAEEITDGTEE